MQLDQVIIGGLLDNEGFARKVLPHIETDYFERIEAVKIIEHYKEFFFTYNKMPSRQALQITLQDDPKVNEQQFKLAVDFLNEAKCDSDTDWLVDKTEEFCRDAAIYNAIKKSIEVIEGTDKKLDKGALPKILQDALAVCFDPKIGHDYFEDWEHRWNYYHKPEFKLALGIAILDYITKGGFSRKTLNLLIAGTHVGKTLVMCCLAAAFVMQGYNVLYITNEMAEEEISRRIDANLLNVPISQVDELSKEKQGEKIRKLQERTKGRFKIKEYPTSTASVAHHRILLGELKQKQNFIPDIILVDYLNITASQFYKKGAVNSYEYMKSVAEELRGLAIESNTVLISATQTNRTGFKDSELDMDGTAESFGVPMTADFILALISSDELKELGQLLCKQLKNRYRNLDDMNKFCIGVDKEYMRIHDLDDPADGIMQTNGEIKKDGGTQKADKFSKFK